MKAENVTKESTLYTKLKFGVMYFTISPYNKNGLNHYAVILAIYKPKYSSQDARTVCCNYEAVHEIDFQNIKNSTTLFSYHSLVRTQGHTGRRLINDNPRSRVNMDN
ncbi:uncharacterized protein Smp_201450 [Schistosoma mansoni]|uniref:Smp_201450 n=1 Tax=Schistosoma mansoni TaxID=6183 RepID=G4VBQ2_SCHMA|nr:uncharacterized protein Smp_201450 [Schistosoma mansoni]|eukprot:XP_018649950.1 uncharacterized protein Smp_201450 [Schistosoma mansoni]